MKAAVSLITAALKQVLRSRRFLAGAVVFYSFLFCFSFMIHGEELPEEGIRFYVHVAWLLLFAYCLFTMLFFPLSVFAAETGSRICYLVGTRPVSRLNVILSRYAGALLLGLSLLGAGCVVLAAGVKVVAMRLDCDVSVLDGCRVFPAPPETYSERRAERLVSELSRDLNFLKKHGEEGVRRIVRKTLSMRRLKTGETERVVWRGIAPGRGDGRIRFKPRVFPMLKNVELVFTVGGKQYSRFITPQTPGSFVFPAEAVGEDHTLEVDVTARSEKNAQVFFPPSDGLLVYMPEISFVENLFRAALLLAVFLGAMTAFGVFSGSSFSFPVGVLASLVLVVIGLGYPVFLSAAERMDAAAFEHQENSVGVLPAAPAEFLWNKGLALMLTVFPGLGGGGRPVDALVMGRMIQPAVVVRAVLEDLVLRGGIVLAFAWFFYSRRELGKRHSSG